MKKIFKTALILGMFSSVATFASGCDLPGKTDDGEINRDGFIDYAETDEKIRLQLDYKGKNFYEHGIAEVEVLYHIDGDTTHFTQKEHPSDQAIKSRYYGIDTPESTGQVEPYGGKASAYTKSMLKAAKTIVVTSTSLSEYKAPETDSTGSRYLSLVWISDKENASYKDLRLLNLYIVQEGYSWVKALDKFPTFKDTFMNAEEQARKYKLNLFSGKDDDDFNYGDYVTTSINDIFHEVEKNLLDPTYKNKYDGEKVKVQGTVVGYCDRIIYLQSGILNEETGEVEYCGINIFTGMTPVPSKYTTYGTYIQVCALAQHSENFGFQLTGVPNFPKTSAKLDTDTQIIFSADETPDEYKPHEFEKTVEELKTPDPKLLFNPVSISDEIEISGGYNSSNAQDPDHTLYISEYSSGTGVSIYIPFLYTYDKENKDDKWKSYEKYVGHKFLLKGGIYSFHTTSSGKANYQIILRDSNDLELIS